MGFEIKGNSKENGSHLHKMVGYMQSKDEKDESKENGERGDCNPVAKLWKSFPLNFPIIN